MVNDCGSKVNYPHMGVFLRDPSLYLRKFWRKITENSERLSGQTQPRIEPGTSCLPAFECNHWCGPIKMISNLSFYSI